MMAVDTPPQTRLVAEKAPRGAWERAADKHGDDAARDEMERVYETFPDTPTGLRCAVQWCKDDDDGCGIVERETLRSDWWRWKEQYQYDRAGEHYSCELQEWINDREC